MAKYNSYPRRIMQKHVTKRDNSDSRFQSFPELQINHHQQHRHSHTATPRIWNMDRNKHRSTFTFTLGLSTLTICEERPTTPLSRIKLKPISSRDTNTNILLLPTCFATYSPSDACDFGEQLPSPPCCAAIFIALPIDGTLTFICPPPTPPTPDAVPTLPAPIAAMCDNAGPPLVAAVTIFFEFIPMPLP